MADTEPKVEWVPFECDGLALEYAVLPGRSKTRPAKWPAHKPSPGSWKADVTLCVRRRGDAGGGVGVVFEEGSSPGLSDAEDATRRFWDKLARDDRFE
jgi:hypothetical protein